MTTAPRILALDLSLQRTGVCRPDGTTSCITTGSLRGFERIDTIVRNVQELCRREAAGLVVLEGYSYGSHNQAVPLGELGGCVRFLLYRLGIPFVNVQPATLKKYATGKGNAPKDAMIAAAIRRFGFAGCENNEADAYLLWMMARHAYGVLVPKLPKLQAEVVGGVTWPVLEAVT